MKYDLYCEFDIEQHALTYFNYLEVLIEANGHVVYAIPSHQEKAMELAQIALGKTRDEINYMCPREYWCDFHTWLLSLSGAIAVWNDFYVGEPNEVQLATLKKLADAGIYHGDI